MSQVLTASGKVGYVSVDMLTSQKEYIFVPENVTMYVSQDTELKNIPSDKGTAASTATKNQEIQLTGSNDEKYWRVSVDGTTYYIDHEELSSKKSSTAAASTTKEAAVNYTAPVAA